MSRKDFGAVVGITRGNLRDRTLLVLERGGRTQPDVLLVRSSDGVAIVKDFAARSRWVQVILGSLAISREARALRSLSGCRAVPKLLGRLDRLAIAIEHRGGTRLSRRRPWTFSPRFVDEFRSVVAEMHTSGVVHLDLSHRDNVRADMSGEVVLVDFASALVFDPGGIGYRWLLPLLARVDERALRKWEIWLAGERRQRVKDEPSAGRAPAN